MPPSSSPSLNFMMTGYWSTQMVYVVAKLGIADLLHRGPQTAEQLAAATAVNPGALYRVLRALASLGIFEEDEEHRFGMNEKAELLREDVPGSQRAMAIMCGEEHYACWGELLYSVRTGKTAFDKIFGEAPFDWLAKHPEQAATFDKAMVSVHGRETGALAEGYDFSAIGTLADIGGGNGSVLRASLPQFPKLRGVLCDLPGVIERAKPLIAKDGLSDRLTAHAINFFESVPAGADAYMMRHIIHDWDDERALTILRNVRRAIGPSGRLLVLESVILPGNDRDFGKLLDLTMLVIPGGKERTEGEYRQLYDAAGFKLTRIIPTKSEVSVIEGTPK